MSDIIGNNEPLVKVACNKCRHYNLNDFEHFSCSAFEDIPDEILNGNNKHTKLLPGQKNDTVFEPIKD